MADQYTGLRCHYDYIHFKLVPTMTKTSLWSCLNTNRQSELGTVKWYGAWRQYCYFPKPETVLNSTCLADIQDFLTQLNTGKRYNRPSGDRCSPALRVP